jgi:hypothetical protein
MSSGKFEGSGLIGLALLLLGALSEWMARERRNR